jgi:threonylcarbamoyladenosine tRNA methylthiotransferase MtaB
MSLQSGCDATLRRMRRPYTADAYLGLVDEVRAAVPGVAVTTDVIVGFPGETGDEFAASLAFVRRAAFAKVHAFPYSSRPGTEAATMPDQVPHAEKRRRMELMLAAAEEAEHRFRAAHLGTEAEVLWEGQRDGRWHGTSDNYLKVFTETAASSAPLDVNTLTPARLARLGPDGLHAEPLAVAR